MSLREIKEQARRDLHEAMRVAAFYFANAAAEPLDCHVRVHTIFKALGDLKGTNFSYAETEEETPKLIFWRDELTPARNSYVTISVDEGYRINHTIPKDGQTITAVVAPLSENEIAQLGLTYPGAA